MDSAFPNFSQRWPELGTGRITFNTLLTERVETPHFFSDLKAIQFLKKI